MAKKMKDKSKAKRIGATRKARPRQLSETGEEIPLPPFHPNEDLITYIERARGSGANKRRGGWSRFLERLRFS